MDYEAEHRKLWDLIVEYIKHSVIDLPKNPVEWHIVKSCLIYTMGYESQKIRNTCFACAYVADNNPNRYVKCVHCPLKWRRGTCNDKHSEYADFVKALYSGERSKAVELAKCIRDLPWED